MQLIRVGGDSRKPEQGSEEAWEGSQCGVYFPAAAGGGCSSVLLVDLQGRGGWGIYPPAPVRAGSAASTAPRPRAAGVCSDAALRVSWR